MTPRAKPKLFRDPVHDTIALPQDSDADRLLIQLLDTPEVQRLRRIRQLGLTSMVYPGAEHSRFQHSLGVLWTAHEMLARLQHATPISPEARTLTLVGALLHDVGHGPMSHALETVTGIHHEHWTQAIIADPSSGVGKLLAAFDPALPERILGLYDDRPLPAEVPLFVREIVSSQLDADRLDYILRDGRATGVRIGSYDLARILALLELAEGHLAIHVGAQEAVEGYLLARFHMYKQVYLHKTSRAAERMLEAALRRAGELRREGRGPDRWIDDGFGRLVTGEKLSVDSYATLDDTDVWAALKLWARDSDPALAHLARGLVDRNLWKPLPCRTTRRAPTSLVHAARAVARVKGFDPTTAVLVDQARDSLYRPFLGASDEAHDDSIRLIEPSGRIAYIEDRSEVVKMLSHLQVRQRLLCVHPDLRDAVARAVLPRAERSAS
ncbi:MAG: HD domain-containing protein [Myxococcota bacterium]